MEAHAWWKLRHDSKNCARGVDWGDSEIYEGSLFLGSYTIDATKSPVWIDFHRENAPAWPGIVARRGDLLIIALSDFHPIKDKKSPKRPAWFRTRDGGHVTVYTLRMKPSGANGNSR